MSNRQGVFGAGDHCLIGDTLFDQPGDLESAYRQQDFSHHLRIRFAFSR
jgi:hypothetical protein